MRDRRLARQPRLVPRRHGPARARLPHLRHHHADEAHVTISGDEIQFSFRGKNSRLVVRTVESARLGRELKRLLALGNGARLFRYQRDGETFNLTSAVLNEYLGENLGNGFTAKDFRTWGGTLLAAVELATHEPPESESQANRVLAAVMRKVGDEFGNTPAVARASYVSPVVVEHYRAGRTIEDFRPKPGSRTAMLRSDEVALVRMLRSKRRSS